MTIQNSELPDSEKPENVQTQPICDLEYLRRMSGGDERFIKEMLRLFLKQVPLELEKLKAAAENEDMVTAKQIAHKLKSSVSMVGAESVLSLLKKFEVTEEASMEHQTIQDFHSSLQQLFIHMQVELEPLL